MKQWDSEVVADNISKEMLLSNEKTVKTMEKGRKKVTVSPADKKVTDIKLSDDCKISQTTYSGYETGHYLINTTNLYYICKTYNVSMDWIVGRTNNQKIGK